MDLVLRLMTTFGIAFHSWIKAALRSRTLLISWFILTFSTTNVQICLINISLVHWACVKWGWRRAQSSRRWQFAILRTCPTYGRICLIGAGSVRKRLNTVCDDIRYAVFNCLTFRCHDARRLCVNVICRYCPTVVTFGISASKGGPKWYQLHFNAAAC